MSDIATATIIDSNDATEAVEEGLSAAGMTDVAGTIAALNTPGAAFYSSIKVTDFATRKAIASALLNSSPIDEMLGETISLVNVIIMPVDLVDRDGNVDTAPRVILIDSENKAYHATSLGLLSAIKNLFATLGEPADWDEALDIRIVQQKGRNGFKFFTITFA